MEAITFSTITGVRFCADSNCKQLIPESWAFSLRPEKMEQSECSDFEVFNSKVGYFGKVLKTYGCNRVEYWRNFQHVLLYNLPFVVLTNTLLNVYT